MTIYHKHHIIPKHMGGTDDASNLIKLTVEQHAEAHRKLYEEHGHWQDYVAWKGLAGLVTSEETKKIAMIEGARSGGKKRSKRIKTPEGVFDSITIAAEYYGVTKQAICKKLKKPHFNHWIYLD